MTGYQSKKAASAAKLFDREAAIEQLANDDFEFIMNGSGAELLDSYLNYGFKGYREYTNEELVAELQQRAEMAS